MAIPITIKSDFLAPLDQRKQGLEWMQFVKSEQFRCSREQENIEWEKDVQVVLQKKHTEW